MASAGDSIDAAAAEQRRVADAAADRERAFAESEQDARRVSVSLCQEFGHRMTAAGIKPTTLVDASKFASLWEKRTARRVEGWLVAECGGDTRTATYHDGVFVTLDGLAYTVPISWSEAKPGAKAYSEFLAKESKRTFRSSTDASINAETIAAALIHYGLI